MDKTYQYEFIVNHNYVGYFTFLDKCERILFTQYPWSKSGYEITEANIVLGLFACLLDEDNLHLTIMNIEKERPQVEFRKRG